MFLAVNDGSCVLVASSSEGETALRCKTPLSWFGLRPSPEPEELAPGRNEPLPDDFPRGGSKVNPLVTGFVDELVSESLFWIFSQSDSLRLESSELNDFLLVFVQISAALRRWISLLSATNAF